MGETTGLRAHFWRLRAPLCARRFSPKPDAGAADPGRAADLVERVVADAELHDAVAAIRLIEAAVRALEIQLVRELRVDVELGHVLRHGGQNLLRAFGERALGHRSALG